MEIISTLSFIVILSLQSASEGARGECYRWASWLWEAVNRDEWDRRGKGERWEWEKEGETVRSWRKLLYRNERCKGCVIPVIVQTSPNMNHASTWFESQPDSSCESFSSAVHCAISQVVCFIHLQRDISVWRVLLHSDTKPNYVYAIYSVRDWR